MDHSTPLIAAIVIGLGLAFVLGTLAQRLRLPPLVGYLLAGVVVGPFTPGFVADSGLTLQLADIGVILLMFGVGLQFHAEDLWAVKGIVIPGATLQMAVIAGLGTLAGLALGWPWGQGLVFGLCLSVASTVVVMRALTDRRLTESRRGRTAIGWLVMQDLLTVLVLVVLPPIAAALKGGDIQMGALARDLGLTAAKLAVFAALMLLAGRRLFPALLHYIAHTGSRELFRLAVLSVALGVAFVAAALFGVSLALGAFFAGMILAGSPLSQRAAEESLPLRDAFAVLFFVSVGMLFNPRVMLQAPLGLVIAFVLVMAGGVAAFVLLRLFGVARASALTIAVCLAQIGEFSFILADLGIGLGVLRAEARDMILGASILSIFLNPLLFWFAGRQGARTGPDAPAQPRPVAPPPTQLSGHAVLVGYGRVGRLIAQGLKGTLPLLAIEEGQVDDSAIEHIKGNAARADMLAAANLPGARVLFVAIPQAFEAGQIVEQARRANPALPIIARAHFDGEVDHLLARGASKVIMGEREIAASMVSWATQEFAPAQ
ncbi:MAG TPA: YbaL family putative K(+) efflux transporter [Rhizomicrobium sp.]|nr:YbaL family putative K(+) efflux transporter [Rhizomicrobium sp.]